MTMGDPNRRPSPEVFVTGRHLLDVGLNVGINPGCGPGQGTNNRFSRTFDDAVHSRSSNLVAARSRYAALTTTLALSRTKPARPYISRLMVFSRFT